MLSSECITHDMLTSLTQTERALVEYLAKRREHDTCAVPATQIEADLGLRANKQNNKLRDMVRSLNYKGIFIVSTSRGFVYPTTWSEVARYCDRLCSYANEILDRVAVIRNDLPPGGLKAA